MGRQQKQDKAPKKVKIRGSRSDKVIVDQFTRKFRRIVKSQGTTAAAIWMNKNGPVIQVGRGKDTVRNIHLPVAKFRSILEEASA